MRSPASRCASAFGWASKRCDPEAQRNPGARAKVARRSTQGTDPPGDRRPAPGRGARRIRRSPADRPRAQVRKQRDGDRRVVRAALLMKARSARAAIASTGAGRFREEAMQVRGIGFGEPTLPAARYSSRSIQRRSVRSVADRAIGRARYLWRSGRTPPVVRSSHRSRRH